MKHSRLPTTLFLMMCALASGENWPQFRGPRGDGTSHEKGLPTQWRGMEGMIWRTVIPGEGHSSPIVWENRIFVTTAVEEGHDRRLLCVDTEEGVVLWDRSVVRTETVESVHAQNNYASSTPATNGELVFTSFLADGRMHLHAFDFEGERKWGASPVAYRAEHGYNHTPMLTGGLVIIDASQWEEPAIFALDQATGKERWRITTGNNYCSNVPPFVLGEGDRARLFTCGNNVVREIAPVSGKVLWSLTGPTDYCVAGLVFGDGLLLACGGYPSRTALAIRVDERGAEGAPPIAWKHTKASTYVPSPVYHEGYFYMINDGGIVTCIASADGSIAWQERLQGDHRASLLLADGLIYATNDEGTTVVFKASPGKMERIAENFLDEFVYASPAPSKGRIYLRTGGHLYCAGAPRSAP